MGELAFLTFMLLCGAIAWGWQQYRRASYMHALAIQAGAQAMLLRVHITECFEIAQEARARAATVEARLEALNADVTR